MADEQTTTPPPGAGLLVLLGSILAGSGLSMNISFYPTAGEAPEPEFREVDDQDRPAGSHAAANLSGEHTIVGGERAAEDVDFSGYAEAIDDARPLAKFSLGQAVMVGICNQGEPSLQIGTIRALTHYENANDTCYLVGVDGCAREFWRFESELTQSMGAKL